MPHRDEHLDLCAALVLGSIDEADRLELERHLASGCDACERALAELGECALTLAATTSAVAPPTSVRVKVLEIARTGGQAPGATTDRTAAGQPVPRVIEVPRPARRSGLRWAMAAAAALLAVSAIAAWRTGETLRRELADARTRLAQAELDLAVERSWAAMATRPGARVVDLAPLGGATPLPSVRATYDPSSRRAIVAFTNLVRPPGGDFELWAILPDGPRSLGVVRPDAAGRAEVRVPDAGDPAALAAFALSLEREGGSPDPRKPAGPVVLAGSIKG